MKRAIVHHSKPDATVMPIWSTVTLAYDDRHRRRIKMTADNGADFLLDLAQATYLADGDLLELEDGQCVIVKAALEEVLDVTCHNLAETARIAWHIGNRHTPVQVLADGTLRLRYDHVLHHMVEGLGGHGVKKTAPFAPEPGAYSNAGGGGGHSHAHH